MAEPLPIAQAFSFEHEHGKSLYEIAEIDTLATVVDACNFFDQINSIEMYSEAKVESGASSGTNQHEMGQIPIAQLFIDQIEFANLVIINKIDLVNLDQLSSVEKLIKKLNPTAQIVHTQFSQIDIGKILNTKKFDFEEAQNSSRWIEELLKPAPTSEIEEYGVSSFVYRSNKPFHPQKFNSMLLEYAFEGIIRAKGLVWVATETAYHICASMNLVGKIRTLEPTTIWWAAVKKYRWAESKKEIKIIEDSLKHCWNGSNGDRRNEIVFIGKDFDKASIVKSLDECLITDAQFELGESEWVKLFKDPFKEWKKVLKTHPMRKNFKQRPLLVHNEAKEHT
jgi:G3E family GTPase